MSAEEKRERELNKRITNLEAIGLLLVEEAKQMRKSLGPFKDRTPRKGGPTLTQKDLQRIIARRMKPIYPKS